MAQSIASDPALSARAPADGWVVAVDFGTAWSKAAAAPVGAAEQFDPRFVRPLALSPAAAGESPLTLPSALFLEKGRIKFGAHALDAATKLDPESGRQAMLSFKTLLGAEDLEESINALVTRRIDPEMAFRQRELLVLYLGFLSARIDVAVAGDPVIAAAPGQLRLRYAQPAWGSSSARARLELLGRLFDEARVVASRFGPLFDRPEGLSYDEARSALTEAGRYSGYSVVEGAVYEQTAAAAAHFVGGALGRPHVVVIDIGAGTTDIGGFIARPGADVEDVPEARKMLDLAGDAIDRVLLNVLLDKARFLRSSSEQAAFWRSLLPYVRSTKESLFAMKKCAVRHGERVVMASLRDVENDRDYRLMVKMVQGGFNRAIDVMAQRAQLDGAKEIAAVAAGGGASLPFVQQLLRKAKPQKGSVKVFAANSTPEWARHPVFAGQLAPVFAQLSIAIGAAIAPNNLVRR
jgi:molecular chaperone DnaK (HSP70)